MQVFKKNNFINKVPFLLMTVFFTISCNVKMQTVDNDVNNKSSSDELFKSVEQMPRFPGCEEIVGSDEDKKKCADEKMVMYIFKSIRYPAEAKENGTSGTAVVQFTVYPDGTLQDINLLRDPGDSLGVAAMKIVESMNQMPEKWTPGTQDGKAVKVLYTLPIKYQLPR